MKQVNSWRPYEAPYVKAMAMSGVTPSECERRLMLVNNKLGAPYRGSDTIVRMSRGSFLKYMNQQREKRNVNLILHAQKFGDVNLTAQEFGIKQSTVRNILAKNKKSGQVHTNYWSAWECAYIMLLHKKGLNYREVSGRLFAVSKKVGRSVRTKHAIANKIRELKKGGYACL